MKLRGLLAFVFCLGVLGITETLAQEGEGRQPLIDCGDVKVVPFKLGMSPDKRYAVGWTIAAGKRAKPVDWAHFAGRDAEEFADDYHNAEDWDNYEFTNCFVDIAGKKEVVLPAGDPYWWHQNHAELGVFWSPGTKFPRYCLMQNQKRFATDNLFLIRMDKNGIDIKDLAPELDKAVLPVLRQKRPLYVPIMAVSYPNSEGDDDFKAPVFHADTVDIQFHADLPKAGYDQVTGWITVSLPEGKVLKVACETEPDDPFHNDPALAKADKELNDVYSALLRRLDAAGRAKLQREQRDWLRQRDKAVQESYPMAGDDVEEPVFTRNRNKDLVETTRKRTTELKAMHGKQ